MPVKRSQSASRVLAVLEEVAIHQPVGVSALAKTLGADKSAIQRALMTLADDGWIRAAAGTPTRWELTAHIHVVAQGGPANNTLRQRARPSLEALRDKTGETLILTVPDVRQFVVVDVLESMQVLRTVYAIGMIVPPRESATGRAMLPYMNAERLNNMLGGPPDPALRAHFARTIERGYSVSEGDVLLGSSNVAAPIFEADGQPVGAIVVSAPTQRMAHRYDDIGEMLLEATRDLSRAIPSIGRAGRRKKPIRRG
jgi:IclR family acetate operon transcriptional repressor